MAFGDLAARGLGEFLRADTFGDDLCVFIHIPKTAGTSLSTELTRLRPPYHNIHRQYFVGEAVTYTSIEDEIAALIGSGAMATASTCSGHFTYAQAEPIRAARPDARFVTFLRDPVKRVISDYRYARTPAHPTYRDFIDRFPAIEDYVVSRESRDKMARFLLPRQMTDPAQIEDFVATRLAFVGLLEMYPMSFNILTRLLGEDVMPVEHRRKTERTADNSVSESPALVELIAQHNIRDLQLYDIVRRNLIGARDDWRDLRLAGRVRAA